MSEVDEACRIVSKLNSLEESKFVHKGNPGEISDKQIPLWKELHAISGKVICTF